MLYDGVVRKEARASLRQIDAYASVKSIASPEGLASFKERISALRGIVNPTVEDEREDNSYAGYTPIEELLGSSGNG